MVIGWFGWFLAGLGGFWLVWVVFGWFRILAVTRETQDCPLEHPSRLKCHELSFLHLLVLSLVSQLTSGFPSLNTCPAVISSVSLPPFPLLISLLACQVLQFSAYSPLRLLSEINLQPRVAQRQRCLHSSHIVMNPFYLILQL